MPSPFQQKYSSQNHKIYNDNPVPAMPEAPKQDTERRGSDASLSSSPTDGRRRSSQTQRFGNLHSLKRPDNEEHMARRQSLHDSYGKVGLLGGLWNTFTRGPMPAAPAQAKNSKDTTTLRG